MRPLDQYPNIPAAFFALTEAYAGATGCERLIEDRSHPLQRKKELITRGALAAKVDALARYLINLGLMPGDRVAIISNTRVEWTIADLAILSAGGVTVSVYQSLVGDELGYILFDSGAKFAFVENEEQLKKILNLHHSGVRIPATEIRGECFGTILFEGIIAFEEVSDNGAISLGAAIAEGEKLTTVATLSRWQAVQPNDLAALVYTSGTTGPPKGVMQTHRNHLANTRQAADSGIFEIGSSIFLYLPLAHSFARLMEFVCMLTPTTLIYPAIIDRKSSKQDPRNIKLDLAAAAARVVPTVPRLLEKIQMELLQRAAGNTGQGRLLRLVLGVADRTFAGTGSVFDKMLFAVTKPIRRKIRVSISGKNFSHFVSGGAKLPDGVARFFTSLEIIVCEGYGLTESCVATNVNRLAERRLGSVGPALAADNEVRILDDGEILLRGPNIAIGYYNRPEATAATWDEEGWLHTGDLGSLDADGFLTVTGRKKELIVTAGGKKIPPIKLEGLLQRSRYISQVAVFGDGKPYCVAIATPQREAILQWLESNGEKIGVGDDPIRHPQIAKLIAEELKRVNDELPSYETVKRLVFVPDEFTIENGLLTPTLKIRRNAIVQEYREVIEGLYL